MLAIESAAERLPVAEGVNVTVAEQAAPAANVAGQSLVCAKSPTLSPVRAMLLMMSAAPPVLVSVTVWPALAVSVFCEPKPKLEGLSPTCGPVTSTAPPIRELATFTSSNHTVPAAAWFQRKRRL